MGWIDIVVIAIIAISAIIGLAKGLFESILSIFGTVLSLFIAIWASKPIGEFLNKLVSVDSLFARLLAEYVSTDGGVTISLFGLSNVPVADAAHFCTILATTILVFILIKLVIWLLAKLFDSATTNNSALSGLNRLLGLVFGAAKGALYVALGFIILSVVARMPILGSHITAEIHNGKNEISSFIYNKADDFVDQKLMDILQDLVNQNLNGAPQE